MYHPNFFYHPHSQYFEESPESYKSDLEILLENFNASLPDSHPNYFFNHQSQHFEESQESHNSNLETFIEDFNATLTYPQPNFLYDHHAQHFEESPESHKSDLEVLMENFTEISMMTERFGEMQNATLTHFEEPQESHNFNFEASMEDSDETLTRLESMMEHFVETQTVQNDEFRKQSLQNSETLRQLTTVVESLATHNMDLETQISLLERRSLGLLLEEHVDVVTANSEEQIKNLLYYFDRSVHLRTHQVFGAVAGDQQSILLFRCCTV